MTIRLLISIWIAALALLAPSFGKAGEILCRDVLSEKSKVSETDAFWANLPLSELYTLGFRATKEKIVRWMAKPIKAGLDAKQYLLLNPQLPNQGMNTSMMLANFVMDDLDNLDAVSAQYPESLSKEEKALTVQAKGDTASIFAYMLALDTGYIYLSVPEAHIKESRSHKVALLRVTEGTGKTSPTIPGVPVKILGHTSYMHLERLLFARGTKTNYFANKRAQGYRTFDMNSYFIVPELKGRERDKAKLLIWNWFYSNYLVDPDLDPDKTLFFFDVFSEKRRQDTMDVFGGTLIEPGEFSPPLAKPNYIIVTTLRDLKTRIDTLIESLQEQLKKSQ